MKTKEELNEIKTEIEDLNKKVNELTGEELEQIDGGIYPFQRSGWGPVPYERE